MHFLSTRNIQNNIFVVLSVILWVLVVLAVVFISLAIRNSEKNGNGIPLTIKSIEENEIFEIVGSPVKIVDENGSISTCTFMKDRYGEVWAVKLPGVLPSSKIFKIVNGEIKAYPE